jgi:hypothetical protein
MRIVLDRVAQTYVDRRGHALQALDRITLTAADERIRGAVRIGLLV